MSTNKPQSDAKLRRTERLQTSSDFRRVFERGRLFRTEAIRIHYLPTERELSRLGLVVSRRRGKAHARARIKRLLREVFRRGKSALPRSYDIILIPRGAPRSHAEYERAMKTFLECVRARREARGRRRADSSPRGLSQSPLAAVARPRRLHPNERAFGAEDRSRK